MGAPIVKVPPALRLAALPSDAIVRVAKLQSEELRALGFTWNFAPVLDVHSRAENPIIGDRSFGTNSKDAARGALAFARGMAVGGMIACGKHFPGHGDTHTDSHLELPMVEADRGRLDAVELAPFRAAIDAGLPSLMTAHVVYPFLRSEMPATLTRTIATDLLRSELGFRGVLVSDDLEMRAVSDRWGVAESAVLAIEAGCDALLVCSDEALQDGAHEALVRRAEKDSAFRARVFEACARVTAMKKTTPVRPNWDRFCALTSSDEARAVDRLLEGI
jgi:beta-N-acetylhexosaminidase